MNLRVERRRPQDIRKSDEKKKIEPKKLVEETKKVDELDERRKLEAQKKNGVVTTNVSAVNTNTVTTGRTGDVTILRNEVESKVPVKTTEVAPVVEKLDVTPERAQQIEQLAKTPATDRVPNDASRVHEALDGKSPLGALSTDEKKLLVDKSIAEWTKEPLNAEAIRGLSLRTQKDPALAPIVGERMQVAAIEQSRAGPTPAASLLAFEGVAVMAADRNASRAQLEKLGPEGAQRLFDALNLKEKSFEPVLGNPPGANAESRMAAAVELLKVINTSGEPTATSAALVDRMFSQIGPSAFKTEWNGEQLGEELGTAIGKHWSKNPAEAERLKGILGSEAGRELIGHPSLTPQARLDRLSLLSQHPEWDAASFVKAGSLNDMPNVLEALAQPRFDQYATLRGDQPQTLDGSDLENTVGVSMGFKSKDIPKDETPEQRKDREAKMARGEYDAFAGTEDAVHMKKVTDMIRATGGNPLEVTVVPIQYNSKETGAVELPLFRVKAPDGSDKFVDNVGRSYASFEDWKKTNALDPGQVTFPKDGHLGQLVKLETTATPRTVDTPGDYVKEALTYGALIGGTVAGSAIAIGSGGTLAPVVVTAAAAYGAYQGGERLYDRYSHGQTINPLQDREAASEWVGVAANTLGVASFGATALAGRLASNGSRLTSQASTAATFFRYGANVADAAAATDAGVTLATKWSTLSGSERSQLALSVGFWGVSALSRGGHKTRPFDGETMTRAQITENIHPDTVKALDLRIGQNPKAEADLLTVAGMPAFRNATIPTQMKSLAAIDRLDTAARSRAMAELDLARDRPQLQAAMLERMQQGDFTRLSAQQQTSALKDLGLDPRLGSAGALTATKNWEKMTSVERQTEFFRQNPQAHSLSKLTPERFTEVFGDGPYDQALARMGTQPKFAEAAIKDPELARNLLRAERQWQVADKWSKSPDQSAEQVWDGIKNDTPSIKTINANGVDYVQQLFPASVPNQPGLRLVPSKQLDHNGAFAQTDAVPDGKGGYTTVKSSTPSERYSLNPQQIKLPDGSPVNMQEVAVFSGHGATNGFEGMSTKSAAQMMAEELQMSMKSGKTMKYVLLDSCSQGDRRLMDGRTNAQDFQKELDLAMKSKGMEPVTVLASNDSGYLYGDSSVGTLKSRLLTPLKLAPVSTNPVEMVPVSQQKGGLSQQAIQNGVYLGGIGLITGGSVLGGGAVV